MDVVVEDVNALTKKITITLPKDGVQKNLKKPMANCNVKRR